MWAFIRQQLPTRLIAVIEGHVWDTHTHVHTYMHTHTHTHAVQWSVHETIYTLSVSLCLSLSVFLSLCLCLCLCLCVVGAMLPSMRSHSCVRVDSCFVYCKLMIMCPRSCKSKRGERKDTRTTQHSTRQTLPGSGPPQSGPPSIFLDGESWVQYVHNDFRNEPMFPTPEQTQKQTQRA